MTPQRLTVAPFADSSQPETTTGHRVRMKWALSECRTHNYSRRPCVPHAVILECNRYVIAPRHPRRSMGSRMRSPADPTVRERDVAYELAFLRRCISTLARGRSAADLDDVASDAWIRLDRTLRREPARNLEALMNRVARFAWVDHCRSLAARTRALGATISIEETEMEAPTHEPGWDPHALAQWRFAVCEWFTLHRPPCLALVQILFSGRTWLEVSDSLGERPNSLAKRWQRCKDEFLASVRRERKGSLREILSYFEELRS